MQQMGRDGHQIDAHPMGGNVAKGLLGVPLPHLVDQLSTAGDQHMVGRRLDGQGKRNAYPRGPVRGPDGRFHLIWVWRDTPDCATNNNLSYARSNDLIQWESITGKRAELPMTLANESLCVDPIPSGGGIINGCESLVFDEQKRPIISYHKADAEGNMQIYAARFESDQWVHHQLTDWHKPVTFSGRGSMGFIGIKITGLTRVEPRILTMTYRHRDYGSGRLVIDEQTLRPIQKKVTVAARYPKEMERPQIAWEGMQIKRASDVGNSGDNRVHYLLQWETLGTHYDRPRQPPFPPASMLKLYKLQRN
jgi:hypothetical protein